MRGSKSLCIVSILLLALTAGPLTAATFRSSTTGKVSSTAKSPAVDPKAVTMMKQMSDYLTSLPKFSVHADTITEGVLPNGQRLDSNRATDVSVERPNKLRANVASAVRNAQIYYNGSTTTIYSPGTKYYGTVQAAPTIDQTLSLAEQKHGLVFPAADLLRSNPYQVMMKGVTSGSYVGQTLIDGVMTNHLAFRRPDMDWQIYIQTGDKPLPKRLIITDKLARGQPSRIITMSDWNLSPTFTANMFTFVPPAGAQQVQVATLGLPTPQGRYGAGTRTPAKKTYQQGK